MLGRIIRFLDEEVVIYLKTTDKKSLGHQMKELQALKEYYGYTPYQYIKHGLYLKSFDGDILDYIPPAVIHRYRDKLNPESACDNVINKKKFYELMVQNNLPTATNLFTAHRDRSIQDRNGQEVAFSEFRKVLTQAPRAIFFIKPSTGGGGKGIYKMVAHAGCLEIDATEIVREDSFYMALFSKSSHDEFIIQPGIIQHELLNRINPSSVNTIRIDTLIVGDDVVHNAALLRMSNGYTCTDNWATGGVIVSVDLDTGMLDDVGRTKAKFGRLHMHEHPLTRFCFGGTRLPFWSQVKKLVRCGALVLRPLTFLGWDVAIGADGPILVEANHDFDIFMSQDAARGLRKTPVGEAILNSLSAME